MGIVYSKLLELDMKIYIYVYSDGSYFKDLYKQIVSIRKIISYETG